MACLNFGDPGFSAFQQGLAIPTPGPTLTSGTVTTVGPTGFSYGGGVTGTNAYTGTSWQGGSQKPLVLNSIVAANGTGGGGGGGSGSPLAAPSLTGLTATTPSAIVVQGGTPALPGAAGLMATIQGSNGNASTTGIAGAGGLANIYGGDGGTSTGTTVGSEGGPGGNAVLEAGNAGASAATVTGTGTAGGNAYVTGGNGSATPGGTGGPGGNVIIAPGQGGTGATAGTIGNIQLTGPTQVTGTNTFTVGNGDANFGGDVGVAGTFAAAAAATVGTTLGVTGLATLGSATVTGAASLGSATVGSTLGVTGLATLGTASVTGASQLSITTATKGAVSVVLADDTKGPLFIGGNPVGGAAIVAGQVILGGSIAGPTPAPTATAYYIQCIFYNGTTAVPGLIPIWA